MQLYPYCINYNHEKLEYYNADGRLAKIVDRRGFETLISYADDKLTVTDTVTGKSVYLEKNQDGKIIRVSDGICLRQGGKCNTGDDTARSSYNKEL